MSSSTDVTEIAWATIASIVYFTLYVALVLVLSIHIHKTEEYENKKDFIKAVWARRGIYGQILVHLYDTATDIGVLVEWGRLAYDNQDYESLDMHIMFWTSIGFLIFYRFLSSIFAIVAARNTFSSASILFRDFCLGIWDFYIIKTVYESLKFRHQEPTPQQKAIQLLESIFESLPQVC